MDINGKETGRENQYPTYHAPDTCGTMITNWPMKGNKQWIYSKPELDPSQFLFQCNVHTIEGMNKYSVSASILHMRIDLPPLLLLSLYI